MENLKGDAWNWTSYLSSRKVSSARLPKLRTDGKIRSARMGHLPICRITGMHMDQSYWNVNLSDLSLLTLTITFNDIYLSICLSVYLSIYLYIHIYIYIHHSVWSQNYHIIIIMNLFWRSSVQTFWWPRGSGPWPRHLACHWRQGVVVGVQIPDPDHLLWLAILHSFNGFRRQTKLVFVNLLTLWSIWIHLDPFGSQSITMKNQPHGSLNVPIFHITQPWSVYGL